MHLFDRHAMQWQGFTRHTYFAALVMTLVGSAAADPKSPQCWDCLQRLAIGFRACQRAEGPVL
jgi:hypothetical protein